LSRPYLETEVVKIKKPRFSCREVIKFMGKKYEVFIKDGKVSIRRHKHQRCKGNWVNGENIDKIKFPCFCSYKYNRIKYYGEIQNDGTYFNLYCIDKQTFKRNFYDGRMKLGNLIRDYDIHILKGKIILFEEEE